MLKRFKSLQKKEHDAEHLDAVFLRGDIYVSRIFLMHLYGVKIRTVHNWFSEKGALHSDFDSGWVNLKQFQLWHKRNINKTESNRAKSNPDYDDGDFEIDEEFLKSLNKEERDAFLSSTKDPLDRLKDIKEIQKKEIANNEAIGVLVSADMLDSAKAEQVMIHIGQYQDDLKIIPKKSKELNEQEMRAWLDNHYEKRISDLARIAKNKSINKIIDLLPILQEKLTQYPADDILEKLDEL